MPENIECADCSHVVYGITAVEPRPVDGEEYPECGGTDFEQIE